MERTDIVVGFDGSAPSRTASRYAATQAQQRHVPLRILAAFDHNWHGSRFGGAEAIERTVRLRFQDMVDEAIAEIHATAPDLKASGAAVLGSPAQVLLDASHTAAMVVVGSRGHGGFAGLMLGSVGQRVATHASSQVVVVRGTVDTADGPVVVGADGSPSSEHTLAVAFEEAARRNCELVAVRAYAVPVPAIAAMPTIPFDPGKIRRAEQETLDDSLRPWREKYPTVPVDALVASSSAGRVLVDLSCIAGLVVVGSHGHGALAGTLLGSVGLQLIHHADCPVLIARHESTDKATQH